MDDYIKRSDAIEALHKAHSPYPRRRFISVEAIKNVPTADVQPVVLCRDCDHWNEWDHVGRETLGNFRCSCAYWSNEDGPICYTGGNDFCSFGERREGGDT